MEANPYAAPEATVDDVRAWDAQGLEERKASRGKRLAAALLDGVINLVCALLVAIFVVNCVMLHRSGQTIGKRMLDIAIVRTDGSRMGLLRYLFIRVLPVALLGVIPYIGRLATLIDPLLIFGNERRCLHDLIADTIVVDV